jgi:hypothetical protein
VSAASDIGRITPVAADLAVIQEPPTLCESRNPSFSAVAERIDQLIARVRRLRDLAIEHEDNARAPIQTAALLIEADLKRLLLLMKRLNEDFGAPYRRRRSHRGL